MANQGWAAYDYINTGTILNTMCLVALCGDKKSRVHPTTLLLITLSFSGNVLLYTVKKDFGFSHPQLGWH
jgi:hypothetical protein